MAREMNKEQLRQTLNTNLPLMVPSNKKSYPILENGSWVVKNFPSDIGEINKIYVSERGESGVVVSLTVEASLISARICKLSSSFTPSNEPFKSIASASR